MSSTLVFICTILLILACSALDRMRGDRRGFNRTLEKLSYGACAATIAFLQAPTMPLWVLGSLAGALAIGCSWGWGEIYGAFLRSVPMDQTKIKKWQVGIFATNVYAAMVLRGLMWAAPILGVAIYTGFGYSIAIGSAVAFPLALIIAKKVYVPEDYVETEEQNDLKDAWQRSEYIRGALVGISSAIKF